MSDELFLSLSFDILKFNLCLLNFVWNFFDLFFEISNNLINFHLLFITFYNNLNISIVFFFLFLKTNQFTFLLSVDFFDLGDLVNVVYGINGFDLAYQKWNNFSMISSILESILHNLGLNFIHCFFIKPHFLEKHYNIKLRFFNLLLNLILNVP